MSDERRRFTRVPFDAETVLQQDALDISVQLVDISLRGLLVLRPAEWERANPNEPFLAIIDLSEGNRIRMEASLVHAEEGLVGFRCDHIDLDSISHLRRLVELNLGDEASLERELGTLLEPPEEA
ncbi:PilZ domain-containing protein [Halopseudomonas xinjiangensis]|uniref:Cyclic diguanosine monophosphate-binding protein n=1 Tax=Halopseudomonas xinjiangensis TaxID=487184 RepID=A0A1H1LWE5_9GAMM|nr:PilZ domain-containing protein [Halopseudomonas xinjiangensis]SDR78914.1 PilZ domain-containing protein [Halopseudomonas xinjiangensis]